MATIDNLIDDHFNSIGAGVDPFVDIAELDIGLFHAGKVAETIYDLAVHPNYEIDPESVAASAKSMLLLLGRLGGLVDALEAHLKRERGSSPQDAPSNATAFGARHPAGRA